MIGFFHFPCFFLYREEIEAAQTLLFGLSAGAGVSALSSSSLQTPSSNTLKPGRAQSSPSAVAPSTSQLNSKRAASESNSEDDSEEEDLGFGDSDFFHDNKYGEMKEYSGQSRHSTLFLCDLFASSEVNNLIYRQTLLVQATRIHWMLKT